MVLRFSLLPTSSTVCCSLMICGLRDFLLLIGRLTRVLLMILPRPLFLIFGDVALGLSSTSEDDAIGFLDW